MKRRMGRIQALGERLRLQCFAGSLVADAPASNLSGCSRTSLRGGRSAFGIAVTAATHAETNTCGSRAA
jgi:hypothetical protein